MDYMIYPQVSSIDEARDYLLKNGLNQVLESVSDQNFDINEKITTRIPLQPDIVDLCRLHRLIIENKRTTILEFGTGWSTLVMAHAQNKLKSEFSNETENLRRNNLFELHAIDDEPEFIEISRSRIPKQLEEIVRIHHSDVTMGKFNERYCTYYDEIPTLSPDFIYVDGPNQFNVKSTISGWSTRHKDMMPMIGDILRFEHFLIPGTIILFDGRAANARFFDSNKQRSWTYDHDSTYDQHIFELDEPPLGPISKNLFEFWNS